MGRVRGTTVVPCDGGASSSSPSVAFVSSATNTGDLKDAVASGSGLGAADTLCQQLATQAGLTGTFAAFLSDATTSAIDRIHDVQGGWYTAGPFPRQIASTKASLVATGPSNHMGDEHGNPVTAGTGADATCASWTSSTANLAAAGGIGPPGNANDISELCTVEGVATYASCASKQPIYCFQQ